MRDRTRRVAYGVTCVAVVAVGVLGVPSAAWAAKMAISNEAGPGQPVGSPIFDTATLSAGIDPTGSITFRLFSPSDPACAGTPVFTSATTVSGGGFYMSEKYTPNAPGIYRWTATYSGDANDPAASSSCSASSATVDVTRQRPVLTGSAAVSGNGRRTVATGNLRGATPTGTLVFKLYGPGDTTCTGTAVFSSSVAVAGNGAYSSAPFTAKVGGAYRWILNFGGDVNNEAASTNCLDGASAVSLMAGVRLSAAPAVVLHGDSVAATWSGIARPSSTDWVALYSPGAPDSEVRAWRYTNGTASGSASLRVPWLTLPGIYEVRLFAQNSYARLAPPARVTVI